MSLPFMSVEIKYCVYSVTRLPLWFPFMQILISRYFLKNYGDLHIFIVVAKGFGGFAVSFSIFILISSSS